MDGDAMTHDLEVFRDACLRLSVAFARIAHDTGTRFPTTEEMLKHSDLADHLLAYVSAKQRNVVLAHDGPRLAPAANVVRLADRRAR
jgi:hypothetical protein